MRAFVPVNENHRSKDPNDLKLWKEALLKEETYFREKEGLIGESVTDWLEENYESFSFGSEIMSI